MIIRLSMISRRTPSRSGHKFDIETQAGQSQDGPSWRALSTVIEKADDPKKTALSGGLRMPRERPTTTGQSPRHRVCCSVMSNQNLLIQGSNPLHCITHEIQR